jgi:hypothetical protein
MFGAEKGKKNLEDGKIEPPKEIAFFLYYFFLFIVFQKKVSVR